MSRKQPNPPPPNISKRSSSTVAQLTEELCGSFLEQYGFRRCPVCNGLPVVYIATKIHQRDGEWVAELAGEASTCTKDCPDFNSARIIVHNGTICNWDDDEETIEDTLGFSDILNAMEKLKNIWNDQCASD